MPTTDELLRSIGPLSETELMHWIEMRWVRPERADGTYLFSEIDCARVELLLDIRHEMAIDDETVPVVLSLLDQVYGLRQELRRLTQAIAAEPETVRESILARLARRDR